MHQFNLKRLGQLIRKQWVENTRLYLYSILALFCMLIIVFMIWLFASGPSYDENSIPVIFFFGLFISGAVFASTAFKSLESKDKGIYWLSFPASHLEKLLTAIFYNLIVFTVVYSACYYVVSKSAIAIVESMVIKQPSVYHFERFHWGNEQQTRQFFIYFFYAFIAVQALYLLGSVYFKRFSFILTTIALGLLFVGMIYYFQKLSGSFPNNFYYRNGFFIARIPGHLNPQRIEIPVFLKDSFLFLLKFIWAPVFWVAAWYRLKEKEI